MSECSVPVEFIKNCFILRYSATFEDNRIAKDMLMDLNKVFLL